MSVVGNVYQHKKRGSVYRITAEGQMKIEDAWIPSVTYIDLDGNTWTREKEKFFDGRFELLVENP